MHPASQRPLRVCTAVTEAHPVWSLNEPSTADGHLVAFGNTLESSIKTVLGLKQIGTDGERPYDRCSGQGFVAACDGDYETKKEMS